MSEHTNEDIEKEEAVVDLNEEKETSEETKSELEIVKEQLVKEKDQYLRLFAEFDNFKKRTLKERLEIFRTANKEVIYSLLPVLDDFDRAIKEIEKTEDKDLLKGIELIHNKLAEILRSKGLKNMKIEAGDEFDTDNHEAITQIPSPTPELKGKVVDVVETGYLLNDVVIRYAKVVVGM